VIKVPTSEDFVGYDGAHTRKLWASVGRDWCCPACQRSKFEIMRRTTRFPHTPSPFEGWVAPLHSHHDHGTGLFSSALARFPRTIICDQCNSADGSAKRWCRLPAEFSFAPNEIGEFVTATAHTPHKIDFDKAKDVYCRKTKCLRNASWPSPNWSVLLSSSLTNSPYRPSED
jgi:hypothetical protein